MTEFDRNAPTTINLLTGFLGSGKTTLLQRLLHDPELAGAAVLINEFGEVGLDHHLLDRIDSNVVLMKSGCLCCTVRGEIADALLNLLSLRTRGEVPWFHRIIIETTGLADPYPVLSTIRAHPVLRSHFSAGNVVATLDAVNGHAQLAIRQEALHQVAAADSIILTKTDLAAADVIGDLKAMVRAINPTATVLDAATAGAGIIVDLSLAPERPLPVEFLPGSQGGISAHTQSVQSFSIVTDREIDWTVFGIWLTMLLHRHGDKVLRVKGILNIGEARPVAVHGVQRLVHPPVHMSDWPDDDRRSKLVFIMQDLDPALVRRSFEVFHAGSRASEMQAVANG